MADESKFEQVKGNLKETAGNVVGNEKLEQEGKASGKVKETAENAKDKFNDLVDKVKK